MAGFGAAIDAPLPLGLLGPQSAIDLPGTDGQKLPLRRCAQPKPLSLPRHPDRQQRLQPHRPRVTGRFPNRRQDGQCFLAIAQRTWPRPPNGLLAWGRTVQKPNRVFPVVAGVETKFVQDHVLYPVPRLAVTLIDGSQVLPFRLMAHRNPPQRPSELGYILNGAITPPSVLSHKFVCKSGRRWQEFHRRFWSKPRLGDGGWWFRYSGGWRPPVRGWSDEHPAGSAFRSGRRTSARPGSTKRRRSA